MVVRQSGPERPLLHGPNHYKEINPQAKAPLPSGAWHECTPKTRPKPGDLLIFTFTSNVYKPSGEFKYGKDWFAHFSILRSIEPIRDISSDKEAKAFAKRCKGAKGNIDKWISVDGGGTTVKEVTRYFCPNPCLIKQGSIIRTVKGWIDVEKVAEAELSGKPGM